jgi:hypothetical protein
MKKEEEKKKQIELENGIRKVIEDKEIEKIKWKKRLRIWNFNNKN